MKIRNGFVSNSSSSSFIVGFKDVPKTLEELQDLIGGTLNEIKTGDEQYSIDQQIKFIWADMQHVEATPDDILGELYTIADHTLMRVRDWLDEDRRRIHVMCFNYGPSFEIYPDWIIKAAKDNWQAWLDRPKDETSKHFHKRMRKMHEAITVTQWHVIDQFKETFKDYQHLYIFSYGDSVLESGEQFGWLPRWYISHH